MEFKLTGVSESNKKFDRFKLKKIKEFYKYSHAYYIQLDVGENWNKHGCNVEEITNTNIE